MHQSFEDRDMLSAEDASQRQHHFYAPTLYHPAAGELCNILQIMVSLSLQAFSFSCCWRRRKRFCFSLAGEAQQFYFPSASSAGILSGVPSMSFHPTNTNAQQLPAFKPPSSPVAGPAHTFGQHAAPTFSELSTRLEGLQQQRHFQEGPSHSLFQASRTVNGPKKRQRDSDDEEGEEAVSRFRSRGLPAAAHEKPELEIPSPEVGTLSLIL